MPPTAPAILLTPESHFDMVRAGIALYGGDPMNDDPADHGLEPALALRSYVAAVKPIAAGESTGYGRRFIAERDSNIATLPIGYGDGVAARAGEQLRRADRRPPLPAARDGQHGQHHRRRRPGACSSASATAPR